MPKPSNSVSDSFARGDAPAASPPIPSLPHDSSDGASPVSSQGGSPAIALSLPQPGTPPRPPLPARGGTARNPAALVRLKQLGQQESSGAEPTLLPLFPHGHAATSLQVKDVTLPDAPVAVRLAAWCLESLSSRDIENEALSLIRAISAVVTTKGVSILAVQGLREGGGDTTGRRVRFSTLLCRTLNEMTGPRSAWRACEPAALASPRPGDAPASGSRSQRYVVPTPRHTTIAPPCS